MAAFFCRPYYLSATYCSVTTFVTLEAFFQYINKYTNREKIRKTHQNNMPISSALTSSLCASGGLTTTVDALPSKARLNLKNYKYKINCLFSYLAS